MRSVLLFIAFVLSVNSQALQVEVHDPVMTKEGDYYYAFSTGPGITIYQSEDMINWRRTGRIFETEPSWARKDIPEFMGHLWAPDVFYKNGRYFVYYSASAFGKNTSAIGVASTPTLNPDSENYQWIDHGNILQSVPGRDDWNAIDAAIIEDDQGNIWMSFGSFWSGLKMVKLDPSMTKIAQPEVWHHIASRLPAVPSKIEEAGRGAIEAPFIFKHEDYYYLFVSFDLCCRKENSTYKIMVGRSKSITGPYVDANDVQLNQGGGTLVLQGNENWTAVGHNSVYHFDGQDFLVTHAYETADNHLQKLHILPLTWQDGWPVVDPRDLDRRTTNLIE